MSELMLKSVYDLLDKNYFIPSYQRGYRWGKEEVEYLLEDIYEIPLGQKYCLQPVVVKNVNTVYELIDGQQRMTTLYLIMKCFSPVCVSSPS